MKTKNKNFRIIWIKLYKQDYKLQNHEYSLKPRLQTSESKYNCKTKISNFKIKNIVI